MTKPVLSIIIVNYKAQKFLRPCLESVYVQTQSLPFEVWMVDNHSGDASISIVRECFPEVLLIENDVNVGFAKANNQAIARCAGDYILLLNPDTEIMENAIGRTLEFMHANWNIGICGCKVLNPDRSLQLACRRTIPTPGVAFFRLTGLSRIFPKNKIIARYNLTYLNPDESHDVDAVSGAFLMIRKAVIDDIGLLDERFFMYGEEMDWCARTKNAGWRVVYCPHGEILHYKGECSRFNSRKAAFEFYRSMYLFHKKHFSQYYNPVINAIIYLGIALKALTCLRSFLFSTKIGSSK
jgi:GT2 family glycosyltransferase